MVDTSPHTGPLVLHGVTCLEPQMAINTEAWKEYKVGVVGIRLYTRQCHIGEW